MSFHWNDSNAKHIITSLKHVFWEELRDILPVFVENEFILMYFLFNCLLISCFTKKISF